VTMRALCTLCLLLVAPGLIWSQASPQKPDSSPNNSDVATELKVLREALLQTQKQMTSQHEEIESLKQLLSDRQLASVSTRGEAPQVIDAAPTPAVLRSSSYDGDRVNEMWMDRRQPGSYQLVRRVSTDKRPTS
jgi:hypothetical protein